MNLDSLTVADKKIIFAYAACGMNLLKAARMLNYSYTGAKYHLSSVKAKTGLNPRDFFELAEIATAIKKEEEEHKRQLFTERWNANDRDN